MLPANHGSVYGCEEIQSEVYLVGAQLDEMFYLNYLIVSLSDHHILTTWCIIFVLYYIRVVTKGCLLHQNAYLRLIMLFVCVFHFLHWGKSDNDMHFIVFKFQKIMMAFWCCYIPDIIMILIIWLTYPDVMMIICEYENKLFSQWPVIPSKAVGQGIFKCKLWYNGDAEILACVQAWVDDNDQWLGSMSTWTGFSSHSPLRSQPSTAMNKPIKQSWEKDRSYFSLAFCEEVGIPESYISPIYWQIKINESLTMDM